jgi:hypothetical protein
MATRTIHVLRWPELDEGRVQALANSIEELGLLQGVAVRETTDAEQEEYGWDGSHFVVVAGFHRAAAWRRLNRDKLDGLPVLMVNPGVDGELVEIDENLVRAHLDGAALAELTARRLARAEAGPETGKFSDTVPENLPPPKTHKAQGKGRGKGGGRPPRPAIKDTADALGVHEDTVRRRARRAAKGAAGAAKGAAGAAKGAAGAAEPRRFRVLLDPEDCGLFRRQIERLTARLTVDARRCAAAILLAGLPVED